MQMQLQPLIDQLTQVMGSQIPHIVGAMGLLVLGWIVAQMIASTTRTLIRQSTLDRRLADALYPGDATKAVVIQKWVGRGVFYLLMILVLIAVLETLQLSQVNEPPESSAYGNFRISPAFGKRVGFVGSSMGNRQRLEGWNQKRVESGTIRQAVSRSNRT